MMRTRRHFGGWFCAPVECATFDAFGLIEHKYYQKTVEGGLHQLRLVNEKHNITYDVSRDPPDLPYSEEECVVLQEYDVDDPRQLSLQYYIILEDVESVAPLQELIDRADWDWERMGDYPSRM